MPRLSPAGARAIHIAVALVSAAVTFALYTNLGISELVNIGYVVAFFLFLESAFFLSLEAVRGPGKTSRNHLVSAGIISILLTIGLYIGILYVFRT